MSRVNEPLNPTEAHMLQPWVAHPYQAASATRLLEGFFLGALEQTPGPDEE